MQPWCEVLRFYTSLWCPTALALNLEKKSLWPQFQSNVVRMPHLTTTSKSLKVCLQFDGPRTLLSQPKGVYLPIQATGTHGQLNSPSAEVEPSPPEGRLGPQMAIPSFQAASEVQSIALQTFWVSTTLRANSCRPPVLIMGKCYSCSKDVSATEI